MSIADRFIPVLVCNLGGARRGDDWIFGGYHVSDLSYRTRVRGE